MTLKIVRAKENLKLSYGGPSQRQASGTNQPLNANHSATSKAILTKMHVQPERLNIRFAFCARTYP